MKNLIKILIFILFIGSNVSYAEEHPIDIELKFCVNKAHSASDINKCTLDAEKSWQKEAQKYIKKINKEINEEDSELVLKNQNQWEELDTTNKQLISKYYKQTGNSLYSLYVSAQNYQPAKERALFLKFIYQNIEAKK